MIRISTLLFCLLVPLPLALAEPKPLQTFKGCELIPTDWADGDSFQIKKPDGTLLTVRLYGADCLEYHVTDDADARRLREQRRYFGITAVAKDRKDAIELAKNFGKTAAEFTARQLKQPFTLHTRMQLALGDGHHQRYFAFVETAEGKDLATELVRAGLARAFGVYNDGPGELAEDRYKEILADTELQAAKRGKGVWEFTDWDKLPAERDIQRVEEEDNRIAQGKAALPADFRLNPNTASRDELDRLPGIGETIANRIIEARDDAPFQEPKDLLRVPGIKQKTLDSFSQYLQFKVP